MVPFISAHFANKYGDLIALLKSVQPATRVLQALCSSVKQQLQTAALLPATKLKKELESFIYNVKVMLQLHKCRDAFWIGNLKHKNAAGKEVSSQLAPPSAVKGKGKGKKRKKDADGGGVPELHEIGDEEAEAGGDDAEPEVEEVDDEEDKNEDDEDEDVDDEETEY